MLFLMKVATKRDKKNKKANKQTNKTSLHLQSQTCSQSIKIASNRDRYQRDRKIKDLQVMWHTV